LQYNMMPRRRALVSAFAAFIGLPRPAAARSLGLQTLALPEPMAQIAAGGPSGLLGVGLSGALYALPLKSAPARRLGDGLDASVPLAAGYGRVAARRRDGALWVLEAGQAGVSAEGMLAPAAGLLVLPLAVVAVASEGGRQTIVRLEPASARAWRVVASSDIAVLPDARPVQADLDGSGDGGHVVVLAGPDGERYRHGVLGDGIEATRLVLLERHSLRLKRELRLVAPYVFEDIAPRKVSTGARNGLLTVQSGPQGAQLVLIDADPADGAALRVAARGAALGTANRWMSPIAGDRHWLAVHTPHIGGVLHEYRVNGEVLTARRLQGDVSNHRIGSRWLDLSTWLGQRLLVPDQSGRRLLLLDAASDWRSVGEQVLPARVAATVALPSPGGAAALLDDGSVVAGSVTG
jgi:hypothetical protein